jgi:hypothetical protein
MIPTKLRWLSAILTGLVAMTSLSTAAAQRRAVMPDRDDLARRVRPLSPELASTISLPDTRIEQLKTPFFAAAVVYRITRLTRTHPIVFTVGSAGPDYAVLLAANPKGFFELASKAGLHLASGDDLVQYVTTFLLATRDFAERFEILRAAADISLIPQATDEQKAKYKTLMEKYSDVIHPPAPEAAGSEVKAFAIAGQNLVEIHARVLHNGVIERSDEALERDLPIAVAQ